MQRLFIQLVPFGIFVVVLAIGGVFVSLREQQRQDEQRHHLEALGTVQALAIERRLYRSLSVTYALASLIRQNGKVDHFAALAEDMITSYQGIHSLALAPAAVVREIYPLVGNEKAIGHDLLNDPQRRTEVLAAIDSKKLTLAGPFPLIQGGLAVIGRLPVWYRGADDTEEFWGLTAAVISLHELLQATALEQLVQQGYTYELWRTHPDTGQRAVFAHSTEHTLKAPVLHTIEVPNGQWTLALSSRQAGTMSSDLTVGIALILLIGFIVTLFARMLVRRPLFLRQQVALRTQELTEANTHLRQEITERQHVEEALARVNTDFAHAIHHNQLILDAAGEGILGLDCHGKITFANPAAAHFTGYTMAELLGQPMMHLLLPVALQDTAGPETFASITLYKALEEGAKHQSTMLSFWRKDDSQFPVELLLTPIHEHTAIVGAVVTFKDISERQVIESMKDEFVAVVSHELRTPLTSMRASLGLLTSGLLGPLSEKGQYVLDIAIKNVDRLGRLINDILDLERITSGKDVLTQQPCNAMELLTMAHEALQGMAVEAGVDVRTLPPETPLPALFTDPDRILQTLTNLLSNAIKFSPRGSTIRLGVEQHGPEFRFQISDQGQGIPDDKLRSIFERFQQVDASDSRRKGGTGLGLAVCRSIIQQHRGRIWAESVVGEGSTFYFTLPLAGEKAPELVSPLAVVTAA